VVVLLILSHTAIALDYNPNEDYGGTFDAQQCVRLLQIQSLPESARCPSGVLGHYLNYLIATISTELALGRIEVADVCPLLRSLWFSDASFESIPDVCQIEFLSTSARGDPAMGQIVSSVRWFGGVVLELSPIIVDEGTAVYPYTTVLWVQQYRLKII